MSSLQNDLRGHRVQAGLSQQELAERAGISRQAFAAVESGKATPATSVALRLARALNTTVQNLFSLADDMPPVVEAELAGSTPESSVGEKGSPRRATITPVGSRLFARPFDEPASGGFASTGYGSARYGLVAADGVILSGAGGTSKVMVQPFDQAEMQTPCVSLLGCDPSVGILEAGLSSNRIQRRCKLNRGSTETPSEARRLVTNQRTQHANETRQANPKHRIRRPWCFRFGERLLLATRLRWAK